MSQKLSSKLLFITKYCK